MDKRRTAVSLQKAVEKKFGVKPKIKTGKPGDLSVLVDGKNIFGFKAEGTMPTIEVLLGRIEAARS